MGPAWGLVGALIGGLLGIGCGDNLEPDIEVESGAVRAVVSPGPAGIEIYVDDTLAWSTKPGAQVATGAPPLGFAAVRDASSEIEMLYGSFRFAPDQGEPWRGVDRLSGITPQEIEGGVAVDFTLRSGDDAVGTGRLELWPALTDGAAHRARVVLEADPKDEVTRMSLASRCHPGEHFVGLGGQSFNVDHRGQTVPLWVQEDGIGKEDLPDDDYFGLWFLKGRRHSTHTPMPMFLSSSGYAQIVDTDARAIFSLCSEADDTARFEVWDRTLDAQLFLSPEAGTQASSAGLKAALGAMIDWVGKPALPPLFAFAPWLDAVLGSANVRRVADRLRQEGIAVSAIWTEDWRGGGTDGGTGFALEEDWRVDRDLYPDFESVASDLHDQGYKLLTYQNTFLVDTADVFAEAVDKGHVITEGGGDEGAPYLFEGVTFEPTTLLDLTSPAAIDWAKDIFREGLVLGSDGWMADFAEWLPTDAGLASGESALAHHNHYPVAWAKLNHDLLAEQQQEDAIERLFFVRAAWLGSQPLVSVVWAGDQQTDFSVGDGYPSVIPMGIGLGLTGFPYFGHDIAGYMSQGTVPSTEELWQRWVTFGALSPVMRTHHGRALGTNHDWETNEDAVAHMRRYSRLHMQLVPYLWGMAGAFERTGLPLFRLIALEWPELPWAWTTRDQYLLGDRILVAPVVVEGATSREVALPPGTYYPLLGGGPIEGGGTVEVSAPPTEIPAFVPQGTMLVLFPEGVDTVIDAPGDDTLVTAKQVRDNREIWLWPGEPSGEVGHWNDELGPAGDPTFLWTGRPPGIPASATFNGDPIDITLQDGFAWVDLVGGGTLTFDGGGTLTLARGHTTTQTRIRLVTD